jgi:uncharacterized protein (DUF1800 family)
MLVLLLVATLSGGRAQAQTQTIQVSATDVDGTNTGTARLGVPVNLTATVSAGTHLSVTWSLQGAGTITHSGTNNVNATYTPPQSMPSSSSVTITAYLTSATSVTTSYAVTLINPVPTVSSASPATLTPGMTQPVVLTGSGFVAGTVVAFNGTTLPVSLTSYSQATVQVPFPASASSPMSLQVQNPAPGGGAGTTFTEGIAAESIALTAVDSDGTNTGTAELGGNVAMSAAVTGTTQTTVNWSVAGAGSISSSGVYTAPATPPASSAVTITATLAANTSVTASYSLTLINPAPVLSSASPAQVSAGTTTSITLTGTGFVPGTALTVSNGTVTSTYQSPTSIVAQVTLPISASGHVTLQAQNSTPGGGTSATLSVPVAQGIQLTATNSDGTNTGSARLGVPVSLVATVSPGTHLSVSWTLQGPGTIAYGGSNNADATYTPPLSGTAGTAVTITAYLTSLPSATVSYSMSLANPVPAITSATPAQLTPGLTQPVALVGSGFVPGMVVLFGGNSYATTYTDSNDATVQLPVPGNVSGSLSMQVQNPAPLGGTSAAFTEGVATPAITITATDADGTNTGTAELGISVTLSATVTGSAKTAVTWSLTGAGYLGGMAYNAPSTMPASSAVTITASLTSNPSITASYSLTLINPAPVIASTSATQLTAGATTSVTLTGTGFVPGTVLSVDSGGSVTATYQSPTTIVAQVTLPITAQGNANLQAQNGAPGGGTSAAFAIPVGQGIQLAASSPDGTNPAIARLGVPVNLTATVSPGNHQLLAWTVQGGGTITFSGTNYVNATYTPPQVMPSSVSVTIVASLSSASTVTTSYALTLVNPVPSVTTESPAQVAAGITQPLALVGSGFIAGTVVVLNGTSIATTYTDYNHATVQLPVSKTATGSLSLQVQNPTPGGGSSTFSEPVAANPMTLTATDADGTNTGTAELGVNVTLVATVNNSAQTVTWSVSGGGSISSGGVYTAPTSMPASSSVTITATLTANPSVTASYTLTLINPSPVLTSANPAQAPAGSTSTVTLTGSGFVPGTVITVSPGSVTATYLSPTSMTAQITLPISATGNVSVQAQNPSPGGGTSATIQLSIGQSILIAASDPDGSNTGTARLGVPVNLTATVSPGNHLSVTWVATGGGTITHSGTNNVNAVYTPPQVMPSSPNITITAYLTSATSITTSYAVALINPVPTVTSASPAKLTAGLTQPVALVGSGFVAGTVVAVNGASLPITLTSYSQATVQVPVPANATGPVSLQVQNPAPGGGAGTTFTESLATAAMTLTATDADGTNTGTAELGVNVTLTANVTGSAQTAVTWSVAGGGSISSGGVYTAPAIMPGSSAVTITATLTSSPSVTASYTLSLINPVPSIASASPAQLPAGTTTTVTLTGTGFLPGTVITASSGTVTTTYQSLTSLVAKVTVPISAANSIKLQAQNSTPGGGTSAALSVTVGQGIDLTATNPDGTNTGTARLGVPVNITAAVSPGNHLLMAWTLQGAGTLTYSGTNYDNAVYTPPTSMPSNSSVTIVGYLSSAPTITTSYTVTLINPVPVVASASPTQLLTGGTQTVTLTGSGFLSNTTVTLNGASLPVALISYNQASVQVPVTATATGTLTLQTQNPAPGGGNGTTFSETIATPSIALTATSPDGTNTGTVELGDTVALTAAVSGAVQTTVNWSVAGAGTITTGGIYTPPSALPANNAVTITASLASNSAVTSSYQLNILNPEPTIGSVNPSQIPSGATTSVSLNGAGFVPGTVITLSTGSLTTVYQSPTLITAQITLPAGASGNLSISAQNPTPGGGTSPTITAAIAGTISVAAAARILDQTTFGPTPALIQQVAQEGITAWLSQQFNTPTTVIPDIPQPDPSTCPNASYECAQSDWWQTVLTGNDQLRQRVAFALSQIFVISNTDMTLTGLSITPYNNILANDAFTNWYTIMTDVTLSPGMGLYLDMLDSAAAGPGQIADENYAREDMQLFNIGEDLLNQDGSLQLDGNHNPIPAYTEAQVQAFAKVFTGWTSANADGSSPVYFQGISNYDHPMTPVEAHHDHTAKTLLNDTNPTSYVGTTLPAGQTAAEDLAAGLTNVFQHPNVPPFVCTQLIQHLVTSTPSPAYISRVTAVFANNGNGVRGDMQAVLTAIFTDPEARAGDSNPSYDGGHLREPMLWITDVMRGLGYVNTTSSNNYFYLSPWSNTLSQSPYASPSVFNFFPPDYVIPGTTLNAPEFGLENTGSVMDRLSLADTLVNNAITGFNVDLSATSPLGQLAAASPASLVDQLGLIFMHSQMDTNTRSAIIGEITGMTDPALQVRVAAYLVVTSPQYKIMH